MAVIIKKAVYKPVSIFKFGDITDGDSSMKETLGGKGANLAGMSKLGVPVPAGFTIPCDTSIRYTTIVKEGKPFRLSAFNKELWMGVEGGLDYLKALTDRPLLLSVRSGARVSMPGMMDTILNVGMTQSNIKQWCKLLGDRTALDSYRRLIQMYSSVALGVPMELFTTALHNRKKSAKVINDCDLSAYHLNKLVDEYLAVLANNNIKFPVTLEEQVKGAVLAVFKSWDNPRAIAYRDLNNIPDNWGTAVTVQSMVLGNLNDQSATGVLFSRNPSNGTNHIVGEFLVNAQGEDVVAGIRTPMLLSEMGTWSKDVLHELANWVDVLETHYRDMQDIEFTVENGKLYILQTRTGKRSAKSAFKIAYDMVVENLITKEQAISRVKNYKMADVLEDTIDESFTASPHYWGIAAGGGVVTGVIALSSEFAINCKEPCILVTKETNPDDILGMNASLGILTSTGGLTSHAAVVARGMNKTCVVGVTNLKPSALKEGTRITLDGVAGRVWVGVEVPIIVGGATDSMLSMADWVLQESGAMKRVSLEAGVNPANAILEGLSSSVYIDTCTLENLVVANYPLMKSYFNSIGDALESESIKSAVINLNTLEDGVAVEDDLLLRMIGVDDTFAEEKVLMKASLMAKWPDSVKSKVSYVYNYTLPATALGDLKGFGTRGNVYTVADVFNASGSIKATTQVIEKVFGGNDAFLKLIKMVEDSKGIKLLGSSIVPKYWYEALFGG